METEEAGMHLKTYAETF